MRRGCIRRQEKEDQKTGKGKVGVKCNEAKKGGMLTQKMSRTIVPKTLVKVNVGL